MQFLDPRGVPSRPTEPYANSAPLAEGESVALFANGFPDSVTFLQHLETSLACELPGVNFIQVDKGNASALASEEHLAMIASTCSAVVTAYGH